MQALQTQVQSLETTVETLGQFLLQLFEVNHDIEIPGDVRRIVQQIGNLDQQRKKPIFIERKIGKSMSVNSNLGFPLKVLEELNESSERDNNTISSPSRSKSQFFENTYAHLRKQSRMRPSQLDAKDEQHSTAHRLSEDATNGLNGQVAKSTTNGKSPSHDEKISTSQDQLDSGIATPLTPVKSNNLMEAIPTSDTEISSTSAAAPPALHPFGNCEEVNFKFNGTTQLKSLRPIHLRSGLGAVTGADGRS